MKKSPGIFLTHILESIGFIEEDTRRITKDSFMESRQTQDIVMRRIEIIGEAVKNLPLEFRVAHPEVPWSDIAGMRDKIIHAYFSVDLELLWAVIKDELPNLKRQIKNILATEQGA